MSDDDETVRTMPTWDEVNARLGHYMLEKGEWCGMPLPVEGLRLTVEPRNPWRDKVAALQAIVDADLARAIPPAPAPDADTADDAHWHVVNTWWSPRLRRTLCLFRHAVTGQTAWSGGAYDYVRKARMLFDTLRAARIWPMDAEAKALETLATLIPSHLFEVYVSTGVFLETSPRSGLTYFFRRVRPTLVLNTRTDRMLCALCLHPIGYYESTHAGAMVPTDDVIAHLLLMRADEHFFWRRANQHALDRPEAGL